VSENEGKNKRQNKDDNERYRQDSSQPNHRPTSANIPYSA
jgi:hypothetical protein